MIVKRFTFPLMALAALSACGAPTSDGGEAPDPAASTAPDEDNGEAAVSILRSDIEQPALPVAPLEPLNITVGFPEGGLELDAAALLELQKIIISEQLELGGEVTLRGHSDAGGSDAVNERVSRARADQVKDWLIENNVAADRIKIIAFGEQNPIEPNALPDGTPNEEGRALNRRVEVLIPPPSSDGAAPQTEADEDSGA